MQLKLLKEKIETFNQKMKAHYNNEKLAIDGIINFELFNNSKPKILWILKEGYGEGCGILDKSYSHYISEFSFGQPFPSSSNMWNIITYTNYGIFKNLKYEDIGDLREEEKIFVALKACAIINLKKILGESTSNDKVIKRHYEQHKDIINEQIALIDPDIVICGKTFEHFKGDLQNLNNFDEDINTKSYLCRNRLFIEALHPSRKSPKAYCDEIIGLSTEFISRKSL